MHSDIIKRVIAPLKKPKQTGVRDVMSSPIVTVSDDSDLTYALETMKSKKVGRLLIAGSQGKIKGIITQACVVDAIHYVLMERLCEIRSIYKSAQRLFKDSVKALFHALDAKDHYTGTHSRMVAKISRAICNEMGLDDETAKSIYLAGLFHDIGKIHISEAVLNRQGPLPRDEYEEIKLHPIMSEMILQPIAEFKHLLPIIRHHHEWYNGKGYPDGLKGGQIPLGARIIIIADSYNAMRTHRPYRIAMPREQALKNIKKMSGKQFDPELIQVLIKVLRKKSTL